MLRTARSWSGYIAPGSPPFQGGGDPQGGAVVPGSTHRDIGARTIHNHPGLRPPLLAKEGSSRWAILCFSRSVLCLLVVVLGACRPAPPPATATHPPQRIVSLSPSITEILFELGLGDRVVGVTDYCRYPAAAQALPKIGGCYDVSYEAVATLRPDLVILLQAQEDTRQRLAGLGLQTLAVNHDDLEQVIQSVMAIGRDCQARDAGERLAAHMRRQVNTWSFTDRTNARPRVLVCVDHPRGPLDCSEVYLAGPGTFYDELIARAGGTNAYAGGIPYPTVSSEGLLAMRPDVVIDILPHRPGQATTAAVQAAWLAQWTGAAGAPAVHVLTNDYTAIPGPRLVLLLGDFARLLHAPP